MATTTPTKRRTTSRAATTKKVAAPEAAPAAVTDEQPAAVATAPEAAAEAPQAAGRAVEASPSLTVQTADADPGVDRASILASFTKAAPAAAPPVAPLALPAAIRTGKTDDWTVDGEGVQALVVVDLFKATIGTHTHFGYKGTVITAPERVIERGVAYGALSKEF